MMVRLPSSMHCLIGSLSAITPLLSLHDRVEGKDVPSHLEKSDNEILIALEHNIIPKQMNPYAMNDIDD